VSALFGLFSRYLRQETERLQEQGVRFEVIGRRDRLPAPLVALIEETEHLTSGGRTLRLRVAVDYSSREAILAAAAAGAKTRDEFSDQLGPDVDLMIRTSGEQRLSDFLLWECAYAELYFTPVAWPDLTARDLEKAIDSYRGRDRRYGGLRAAAAPVLALR
jgi:undecaprenyl diphosphate synthase